MVLMSSLHYLSSRSDFCFEFAEIFVIEKRLPALQVGESTRFPIDTIFFKPLNKSMVIVHYIPSLFFGQIGHLMGWFSRLKFCKSMINLKNLNSDSPTWRAGESATLWLAESGSRRLSESPSWGVDDYPTHRWGEFSFKHSIADSGSPRVRESFFD